MTRGAFDPDGAVEFDLARGVVEAAGDRLLVVPASLLEDIGAAAGVETAALVARALGASCGRRIVARMGGVDAIRAADVETVVSFLAGELALSGVGAAHLERWGRALVVVLANAPAREDAVLAALVEGALAVVTGRPLACLLLAREEESVRVLVGSAPSVERVRASLQQGTPWGQALTMLHARGDA